MLPNLSCRVGSNCWSFWWPQINFLYSVVSYFKTSLGQFLIFPSFCNFFPPGMVSGRQFHFGQVALGLGKINWIGLSVVWILAILILIRILILWRLGFKKMSHTENSYVPEAHLPCSHTDIEQETDVQSALIAHIPTDRPENIIFWMCFRPLLTF